MSNIACPVPHSLAHCAPPTPLNDYLSDLGLEKTEYIGVAQWYTHYHALIRILTVILLNIP